MLYKSYPTDPGDARVGKVASRVNRLILSVSMFFINLRVVSLKPFKI